MDHIPQECSLTGSCLTNNQKVAGRFEDGLTCKYLFNIHIGSLIHSIGVIDQAFYPLFFWR